MHINDIHWHDSVVRKVVEVPDPDAGKHKLLIEVDYPVDWENEVYQVHTVHFNDLLSYEIHEGPNANVPTLLGAGEVAEVAEHIAFTVRIETTSGFRIVRCGSISLTPGGIAI